MSKITGDQAEALWRDDAQFVHDLRNRLLTIEMMATGLQDSLPRLTEAYRKAEERGEVEQPLGPLTLQWLATSLDVLYEEVDVSRILIDLHWKRVDETVTPPPERWQGNGGRSVRRAREILAERNAASGSEQSLGLG